MKNEITRSRITVSFFSSIKIQLLKKYNDNYVKIYCTYLECLYNNYFIHKKNRNIILSKSILKNLFYNIINKHNNDDEMRLFINNNYDYIIYYIEFINLTIIDDSVKLLNCAFKNLTIFK